MDSSSSENINEPSFSPLHVKQEVLLFSLSISPGLSYFAKQILAKLLPCKTFHFVKSLKMLFIMDF
jgi:hypothetical protein